MPLCKHAGPGRPLLKLLAVCPDCAIDEHLALHPTELAVGPPLDAEVARVVFGYSLPASPDDPNPMERWSEPYSMDVSTAMSIIDHFRARGKSWIIRTLYSNDAIDVARNYYVANHDGEMQFEDGWPDGSRYIYAYAPTLPEAICRAALEAALD